MNYFLSGKSTLLYAIISHYICILFKSEYNFQDNEYRNINCTLKGVRHSELFKNKESLRIVFTEKFQFFETCIKNYEPRSYFIHRNFLPRKIYEINKPKGDKVISEN